MLAKKIFRIPYPRPPNLPYPAPVLSKEGPLSRSDPSSGQSESWPDRGAPERPTAWWPVERWEALRLALGARGALPREVGTLIPPPRVPIGALAPPNAPHPRVGSARDRQTSDALRRENADPWLFEFEEQFEQVADAYSASGRLPLPKRPRPSPGELTKAASTTLPRLGSRFGVGAHIQLRTAGSRP